MLRKHYGGVSFLHGQKTPLILPRLVAGMALSQVGGEGDFSVLQGGSPVAEFFSLTAEQIRERIIESGELSAERLNEALDLLKSPDFWAFGGGTVAVWGQRQS